MAETAAESTINQQEVKIEDSGPARKRLTITVPAAVIDEKLSESMGTLAHETALPGFRKGKAPKQLLERKFGKSLRTETKNQIIASAYAQAIEEHSIRPLGEPEPDEGLAEIELEQGKPLIFSLEIEIVPAFELPSFDSIEVKKPMLEISDQQIDDELKRQQLVHGNPQDIESEFQDGDRLVGYATVTRNDESEPFFRQDHVPVTVPGKANKGQGQVLGVLIDGLNGQLIDKRVGDSVTFETIGPDNHERADIRGAKLAISYEIRAAQRIDLADPAKVAESFGLPNEQALRAQIRLAMEHRRNREQAAAMREQATDQLADLVNMELPENLSAQQATRYVEQSRLELLQLGLTADEVEQHLAEIRADSETEAKKRIKRFFLLERLSEHYEIQVSDQEINGRIAEIAIRRQMRPERLRSELSQTGGLAEVSRMIRDEKACDRLIGQVKQVEVSAEEWNKLFRDKQKPRSSDSPGEDKPAKRSTAAKGSAAPRKKTARKTSSKKTRTKKS